MTADLALLAAIAGEPLDAFREDEAAEALRAVEAIANGLRLVAADLDEPAVDAPAARPVPRGPRLPLRWVAAAAAVVALAGTFAVATRDREGRPEARPTPTPSASRTRHGSGSTHPDRGWQVRAREADRIVIGTVGDVRRARVAAGPGIEGSFPYLIAHVTVESAVKGSSGDVDVFTYELVDEGAARPWTAGQRVLLFLVKPDPGSLSAQVQVPHLDLAEGDRGRYDLVDGRLVAPFTLDELRAVVAGR